MTQKRKAAMLLAEACPHAQVTQSPPLLLPVAAEPLYSPPQILELVNRFMQEKGLTLQRQNHIKLNSIPANGIKDPQKSVPWLSLRGAWLQKAGFAQYEYAKTIACQGMLIVIPGINPPVVTERDLQHIDTLRNKIARYVHTQK
jgi:hypothetical protein